MGDSVNMYGCVRWTYEFMVYLSGGWCGRGYLWVETMNRAVIGRGWMSIGGVDLVRHWF